MNISIFSRFRLLDTFLSLSETKKVCTLCFEKTHQLKRFSSAWTLDSTCRQRVACHNKWVGLKEQKNKKYLLPTLHRGDADAK